jgi:hypothetical protein
MSADLRFSVIQCSFLMILSAETHTLAITETPETLIINTMKAETG